MLNPGHPDYLGVFCLQMEESIKQSLETPELKLKQKFRGIIAYKDSPRKAYEIRMIVLGIIENRVTGKFGINTIDVPRLSNRVKVGIGNM